MTVEFWTLWAGEPLEEATAEPEDYFTNGEQLLQYLADEIIPEKKGSQAEPPQGRSSCGGLFHELGNFDICLNYLVDG